MPKKVNVPDVPVMLFPLTFPTVTLVKDVNVFCFPVNASWTASGTGLLASEVFIDVPQTDHRLSNAIDGTSERGVVLGSFFVYIHHIGVGYGLIGVGGGIDVVKILLSP